jgi:hypothetical protein
VGRTETKDAARAWPEQGTWAPEPLLYHGGFNQKNLAHIWLEPRCDFAMILVTNIGVEG